MTFTVDESKIEHHDKDFHVRPIDSGIVWNVCSCVKIVKVEQK